MATNDEGAGKGPGKGTAEPQGPKKPAAIIDLKPTSVGVEEPRKPAQTAASPGKPPEQKPQEANPTATASAPSVPGSGTAAKPATPDVGKAKPAETAADKPAVKPFIAAGAPKSGTSSTGAGTASASPPAKSGGMMSGLSHLAAGLAGGLLVLFGADALGPLGIDAKRADSTRVREIEGRLAAVETTQRSGATNVPADLAQRLAAAEQRAAQLEQVRQRIGEIDQRQNALIEGTKTLEERLLQAPSETTAARVAKLEDTLTTLSRAAGEGGRVPQLAAITGRLADLEATLTNQLTQLRKSVVADVESRMTSTNEASEAARNGTARIDRELATQKADAARMGQRIDGFRTQVDRVELGVQKAEETATTLRRTIEQLRGEIKGFARPADVATAVEPVTVRMARLEQSLQSVEKSEEDRRNNVERIVLALELGNLKRVVERGAPFLTELAQVRRVAGNRIDLSALDRYQDQGVPTVTALQREFRDIVHRILEADRASDNAGIVDRLMAGAKSIVRVRRTDTAADDVSAEATVARMEAALKEGRLAEVAASATKLSAPARKVAGPWLDRVEASAAVERAISTVESELKSSLGAAGKRG